MCLIYLAALLCILTQVRASYWQTRQELLANEQRLILGSELGLSAKELIANKYLMKYKVAEIDEGFRNASKFLPSQHFFKVKDKVEQSKVFKILQKMPKGGALHIHDLEIASVEYVHNLTFNENLYACISSDRLYLSFLVNKRNCHWKPIREFREKDDNFDEYLRTQISVIRDEAFSDIDAAWKVFEGTFSSLEMMLTYKPIFVDYLRQVLMELYDDNVMYAEIRATLPQVYNLDGTTLTQEEVVQLYLDTVEDFKNRHPDFQGIKLIYASSRRVNTSTLERNLEAAINLTKLFPGFVVGFDLQLQEDKGHPLIYFMEQLLAASREIKFIFHAGETNWYGQHSDINLVDALLLNSTRIGHAYALIKHPEAVQLARQRNVPIEINPISNQVLELVSDIRNHPGVILISQNYPVIISSDDPGYWGAKGVSYDWYYAFMGMTPVFGDLRLLKKLAMNSLMYSSMDDKEKTIAMELWHKKWDDFINYLVGLTTQDDLIENMLKNNYKNFSQMTEQVL